MRDADGAEKSVYCEGWVGRIQLEQDFAAHAVDLRPRRDPECPVNVCAVRRRRFPVGASPTRRTLSGLLTLAATLPDTRAMFGPKGAVDSVKHLIGAASAWGGNPEKDALYLNVVPAKNDGNTVYRLNVKDVPVDGFWSISVYNAKGYFEPNPQNAYSLNNITAKANADGSVPVQFGGCDGKIDNCLPTPPGWNYLVRLYRPRAEVLDGRWTFPEAKPTD